MRVGTCLFAIVVTVFGQNLLAGAYHIRYLTAASCTSGTFRASQDLSPGTPVGQTDFDGFVKALGATVVEKEKSGAILFQADGAKSMFCPDSKATPAWVTISYDIMD